MKTIRQFAGALTVLFSLLFADSYSQEINFEKGAWKDVTEKSQLSDRLIFVDAFTTWCGPCKWMSKNVFTNDTVGKFFNANFINYKYDMEKGDGLIFAKNYQVSAYPTLLFLNPKGEIVHRVCGAMKAQDLIKVGQAALDNKNTFSSAKKAFDSGKRDAATVMEYIKRLDEACMPTDGMAAAYFANVKEEDMIKRENWRMIEQLVTDIESKEFKYLMQNRQKFYTVINKDTVSEKIFNTYVDELHKRVKEDREADYQSLKQQIKASGYERADQVILYAEMRYYKFKKSWGNYANAAISYYDMFPTKEADVLNSLAWTFYEQIEAKPLLASAEMWAKKAVEIAPIYSTVDTYAAVLYKLGKKEQAMKQAELAIKLGKESGEDISATEDLLKKIKALDGK